MVKNLPAMRETWVRSLGLGRARGEGYGNPLQYSFLENSMVRGAWWAAVHGVIQVPAPRLGGLALFVAGVDRGDGRARDGFRQGDHQPVTFVASNPSSPSNSARIASLSISVGALAMRR